MNSSSIKKYIFSLVLLSLLVVGLGFSQSALAGDVTLRNPLSVTNFNDLFTRIFNFITEVVGALAILMLVVAGIFFVLAGANPENVNKAKHIALYAIIGLGIALAGRGLIGVVNSVIGVTAT